MIGLVLNRRFGADKVKVSPTFPRQIKAESLVNLR